MFSPHIHLTFLFRKYRLITNIFPKLCKIRVIFYEKRHIKKVLFQLKINRYVHERVTFIYGHRVLSTIVCALTFKFTCHECESRRNLKMQN